MEKINLNVTLQSADKSKIDIIKSITLNVSIKNIKINQTFCYKKISSEVYYQS